MIITTTPTFQWLLRTSFFIDNDILEYRYRGITKIKSGFGDKGSVSFAHCPATGT